MIHDLTHKPLCCASCHPLMHKPYIHMYIATYSGYYKNSLASDVVNYGKVSQCGQHLKLTLSAL